MKVAVCAILPAEWKSTQPFVRDFIERVQLQVTQLGVESIVILSIGTYGRQDWELLEQQKPGLIVLKHPEGSIRNASIYLDAFAKALELGADLILEIDASGAHDPDQIGKVIEQAVKDLQSDPENLVFAGSTRVRGGSNYFPLTRRIFSRLGTLYAKFFLLLGKNGKQMSDYTSGFEAFSRTLLTQMFALKAQDELVSVKNGPLHLVQTELRAMVCWLNQSNGVTIYETPIDFGAKFDRKVAPLKIGYVLQALLGAILLTLEALEIRYKVWKRG